MSPDFRTGEAHLYPAEPAGSTRTTEAIDKRKKKRERDRGGRDRERVFHLLMVKFS